MAHGLEVAHTPMLQEVDQVEELAYAPKLQNLLLQELEEVGEAL